MAGKSLGTLTIDLIARVGGFVAGMDRAERSSDEWSQTVQKNAVAAAKAIASVASVAQGAAVAVGVAGYQLLKTTAAQISETDKWAKSLNMSTQELLAWQFAAEKAGLAGENMNDIFKDIGDKIGDAVLNKSGDAVDALDALGLSAEKLSKATPDKQLLAIGEAIGKIGTNAEKVTILESLGNDLSKMLPLFDNNNEKLKQFIQLSKDYGVAPKPESIDDLVRVNDIFQQMEDQVKGLKIEIATGLAKADLSPLQVSLDKLHAVLTDPGMQQGLVDLVSNVASLAGWLIKTAAAAGNLLKFQNDRVSALGGNVDKNSEDQINGRIEQLQKFIDGKQGFYGQEKSMFAWITGGDDSVKALTDEMNGLIEARDKLRESKIPALNLPTQAATVGSVFGLGSGESNGKDKPDAGAKKLDNAFKATELNYKKQIELIVTTGKKIDEVTELQKLQFDISSGKLSGLSDQQKKRLEDLARELDLQKQLKKTNEENLKVSQLIANLNSQNVNDKDTLDIDIQGAWLGDAERDRMKERLSIQADFLRQQRDLQTQFQSGDISQSLFDKETEALNNAMEDRLQIQEDYYKQVDELRNNGTAGFVSGLATQIEASMDLYSNMQQVGAEAFSSLTDMLVLWAETGKLNVQDFAATFLQSVGTALLSYAAAQVAMAGLSAFSAMIGVPFVGPAVAPGAAIAATAAAGVLAIGVGSALKGQAHDGIDSVPETGTWLLQKGERVTTAQTSAKLDATLERVSAQSAGGMNFSPVISVPINGNPSDSTVALVRSAVKEATLAAYNLSAQDLATGTGKMSKAMGNWATGRKVS